MRLNNYAWSLLSAIVTVLLLAMYFVSGARHSSIAGYPLALRIIAGVAFLISPISAFVAMLKEPRPFLGIAALALVCVTFFLYASG